VMEGSRPRMRDETNPDWRFAFVPRDVARIENTWDALGLRGTGSHHLSLDRVRVPAEHFAAPVFEPARHDGPLWRLGLFDLAGVLMFGFPLGVARRALDEFTVLARTKFRGNPANTLAGNGHTQMLLARAESRLRAARLFVYDVVDRVWDTCCTGDRPASRVSTPSTAWPAPRRSSPATPSKGASAIFTRPVSTSCSARCASRSIPASSSESIPRPTDQRDDEWSASRRRSKTSTDRPVRMFSAGTAPPG
jgi:indole-3-acetate monooxygenase